MSQYTSKQGLLDNATGPNRKLVENFRQVVATEPNRAPLVIAESVDFLLQKLLDSKRVLIREWSTTTVTWTGTNLSFSGPITVTVGHISAQQPTCTVTMSAGPYSIPASPDAVLAFRYSEGDVTADPTAEASVTAWAAPYTIEELSWAAVLGQREGTGFRLANGAYLRPNIPYVNGVDRDLATPPDLPAIVAQERRDINRVVMGETPLTFTVVSPTEAYVSGSGRIAIPTRGGAVLSTDSWNVTLTNTHPVLAVTIPPAILDSTAGGENPMTGALEPYSTNWEAVGLTMSTASTFVLGYWDHAGPEGGMLYVTTAHGSVFRSGDSFYLGRGSVMSDEEIAQKIKGVTEFADATAAANYKVALGYDPERHMVLKDQAGPSPWEPGPNDGDHLYDTVVDSTNLEPKGVRVGDLQSHFTHVESLVQGRPDPSRPKVSDELVTFYMGVGYRWIVHTPTTIKVEWVATAKPTWAPGQTFEIEYVEGPGGYPEFTITHTITPPPANDPSNIFGIFPAWIGRDIPEVGWTAMTGDSNPFIKVGSGGPGGFAPRAGGPHWMWFRGTPPGWTEPTTHASVVIGEPLTYQLRPQTTVLQTSFSEGSSSSFESLAADRLFVRDVYVPYDLPGSQNHVDAGLGLSETTYAPTHIRVPSPIPAARVLCTLKVDPGSASQAYHVNPYPDQTVSDTDILQGLDAAAWVSPGGGSSGDLVASPAANYGAPYPALATGYGAVYARLYRTLPGNSRGLGWVLAIRPFGPVFSAADTRRKRVKITLPLALKSPDSTGLIEVTTATGLVDYHLDVGDGQAGYVAAFPLYIRELIPLSDPLLEADRDAIVDGLPVIIEVYDY